MITLDFTNVFAHAWFRTCMHRGAVLCADPSSEKIFLDIRERAHARVLDLSGDEAELALWACERMVGNTSFSEARQEIVDQLKKGLS